MINFILLKKKIAWLFVLLICFDVTSIFAFQKRNIHPWESANQSVKNMKIGWNLGNTLDARRENGTSQMSTSEYETFWGQPVTTKAMIDMYKKAGFNTIRIPITWEQHLDSNDNIDQKWMKRVEEVVNYVVDNNMYCIINIHHDTGAGKRWLRADIDEYLNISARFKKVWRQIANHFKKYDKRMIFEAFNEMLDKNSLWDEPKEDVSYIALNRLNQDFVDVVRSTGGNNVVRNLCVNTYAAAYTKRTLSNFVMPIDIVKNHLMVQIHMYPTFNFALNKKSDERIFTQEIKQNIETGMKSINNRFRSKNIPVIIGEFGAIDKHNELERAKQAACIVSEAKKYGYTCIKWMGLLNRWKLTWNEPLIKNAIINNAK